MTTIYIVTSGEYSEYGIESVFDDKALADAYVAIRGEDAQIEEYTLNEGEKQIRQGFAYYLVSIHKNDDGNASFAGLESKDSYLQKDNIFLHRNYSSIGGKEELCLMFYAAAKDKNHALKIASEKRAQLIATGEWDKLEAELKAKKQ